MPLLLFFITLVCLLFLGFALLIWRAAGNLIEQRRRQQLATLKAYSRRLCHVVDSLLTRADHIDQEHKYLPQAINTNACKQLGKTCSDLVALSESLKLIDRQLQARNISHCRETLLQCIRIAGHASSELSKLGKAGFTEDR